MLQAVPDRVCAELCVTAVCAQSFRRCTSLLILLECNYYNTVINRANNVSCSALCMCVPCAPTHVSVSVLCLAMARVRRLCCIRSISCPAAMAVAVFAWLCLQSTALADVNPDIAV